MSAPSPSKLTLPAHGLALVLGAGLLITGVLAIAVDNGLHRAPDVIAYPITASLLSLGSVTMWLAWRSYERSRGAWSLLLSAFGTLAAVAFFAAPRLHSAFGLSWGVAFLPALLFAVATVLLVGLASHYRQ